MSFIISVTDNGYRKECEWCDGTGIDTDSPGGADPCPYCENGVQTIEYDDEGDDGQ